MANKLDELMDKLQAAGLVIERQNGVIDGMEAWRSALDNRDALVIDGISRFGVPDGFADKPVLIRIGKLIELIEQAGPSA